MDKTIDPRTPVKWKEIGSCSAFDRQSGSFFSPKRNYAMSMNLWYVFVPRCCSQIQSDCQGHIMDCGLSRRLSSFKITCTAVSRRPNLLSNPPSIVPFVSYSAGGMAVAIVVVTPLLPPPGPAGDFAVPLMISRVLHAIPPSLFTRSPASSSLPCPVPVAQMVKSFADHLVRDFWLAVRPRSRWVFPLSCLRTRSIASVPAKNMTQSCVRVNFVHSASPRAQTPLLTRGYLSTHS